MHRRVRDRGKAGLRDSAGPQPGHQLVAHRSLPGTDHDISVGVVGHCVQATKDRYPAEFVAPPRRIVVDDASDLVTITNGDGLDHLARQPGGRHQEQFPFHTATSRAAEVTASMTRCCSDSVI